MKGIDASTAVGRARKATIGEATVRSLATSLPQVLFHGKLLLTFSGCRNEAG